MKKVIICDFDGTLIEENIENMFTSYLLQDKRIRYKLISVALLTLPINIIRNKLFLPSLIKSWTFVLQDKISFYIDDFLQKHKDQIHIKNSTIELINRLRYDKLIILTGSYHQLVEKFLAICLPAFADEVIGSTVKGNKFVVDRHPYGKGKKKFVDIDNYNIGIANEDSDRFYLDLCNEKFIIK